MDCRCIVYNTIDFIKIILVFYCLNKCNLSNTKHIIVEQGASY